MIDFLEPKDCVLQELKMAVKFLGKQYGLNDVRIILWIFYLFIISF